MKITLFDMQEAKEALSQLAETQAAFWDALSAFERATGLCITDSSQDFTGYTDPDDNDVLSFIEDHAEENL